MEQPYAVEHNSNVSTTNGRGEEVPHVSETHTGEVGRALFSEEADDVEYIQGSGFDAGRAEVDAEWDEYDRFVVEDVLPESRRGSRTHRAAAQGRLDPTTDSCAADAEADKRSSTQRSTHAREGEQSATPHHEYAMLHATHSENAGDQSGDHLENETHNEGHRGTSSDHDRNGSAATEVAMSEVMANEAIVRPLAFAPYPPHFHPTDDDRGEVMMMPPPLAEHTGRADHWNDEDWQLPTSMTAADLTHSFMTAETSSAGPSEVHPSYRLTQGSRGSGGGGGEGDYDEDGDGARLNPPPFWMRSALNEPHADAGVITSVLRQASTTGVPTTVPASAATPIDTHDAVRDHAVAGESAPRDDPFTDPTDRTVGVLVRPSAPADDVYSIESSRNASTITQMYQSSDAVQRPHPPPDANMTTIEVGGDHFWFGDETASLPPATWRGELMSAHAHPELSRDEPHDARRGDALSPSEYFRQRLTAAETFRVDGGGEDVPGFTQDVAIAPSGASRATEPPSHTEQTPTAATAMESTTITEAADIVEAEPIGVKVSAEGQKEPEQDRSTAAAAEGQTPPVQTLRARHSNDNNDDAHSNDSADRPTHTVVGGSRRAGSKPRVAFRDEVEEFSAPRPASTTEEEDGHDGQDGSDYMSLGADRRAGSAIRAPPPPTTVTADELQAMRLRSFLESSRRHEVCSGVTAVGGQAVSDTTRTRAREVEEEDPDAHISTLDFLKETSNVILPDFMNAMFASTSSFFERSREKVSGAIPEPLKKAAGKTQQGVSMVLDFTSDAIGAAPTYMARAIPDALMSAETKQLVFIDFANVMRCCVNVNLLVVPFVFRATGLVGALVVLALVAVVCGYCSESFYAAKHQLRDAAYVVTYGDVPRLTWGRWSTGFSMAHSTVFLIAFTAYASSNARVLLATMGMPSGGGATALSVIVPPLCSFPFIMCKRAKSVEAMGALTTLLIIAAVVLLFVALPYRAVRTNTFALKPATVTEFFVGLNIAVYVFSPLSLSVPVERTMAPRRFKRLLRLGMLIQYLLGVAFGLCAYLSLTSNTCAVLPVSIRRQMSVTIFMHNVDAGLSAVLFFAFLWFIPRLFFTIGELCDQRVLGLRTIPTYWQFKPNVVRFIYLALVSLAAYVVPYFGIWVALGGALGSSVASILIPAALDYVRRERLGFLRARLPRWWELMLVFAVVLFGLAVVLVGGVLSIFAMWAVVQTGAITTC